MGTKVFVNLPVKDLEKSVNFFKALGFSFNPQFTDENAACMIISDENFAMLLREEYFKTFTVKPISDAHKTTEVLVALGLESKEAVDAMVSAAKAAGGKEPRPKQDHGFMVQRTFEDLDGHTWEAFWMNPAHVHES